MYKQNVQKYFENISKITPQYFQAITNLQNECLQTCEKTINATISTQQEFAKKAGILTEIPDTARTAIVDINKQIVQASTVNNQLAKTAIDTTVQNIFWQRVMLAAPTRRLSFDGGVQCAECRAFPRLSESPAAAYS